MKITFVNARRVNYDRDGFDFQYFYTIDEEETVHRIHVVTGTHGAELAWHISREDEYEYSLNVFTLVVDFIKRYWEINQSLPEEEKEYFEGRALNNLNDIKTNWNGYVLTLE